MSDEGAYGEAVAEAQRMGLMSGSIATNRCQCSTCGEILTTEANFNRHLRPGRNAPHFEGPWCQPPAAVGLIQHGEGWWHQSGPEEAAWEGRSNSDRGVSEGRGSIGWPPEPKEMRRDG